MKESFAEAKQYFAFQWHITDACDQRCKHCYIFSEDNCKKPESVSWDQMQEVVANCEDFCEVYHRPRRGDLWQSGRTGTIEGVGDS